MPRPRVAAAGLARTDEACEPSGVTPNPVTAQPDRASTDRALRGEPVAREVFTGLPDRYDRLAYLLSLGQDRRWRRAVVNRAAAGSPGLVLDVATGPGGIALAVAGRTGADVAGVDLNEPMLRAGLPRIRRPLPRGRVRVAGARRSASVRRRHVRRGDLLLPAALRGRPSRHDRRDGPLPAPRRHAGLPGIPRPAAAGLAGRLVVLHPAGAAGAGRRHRGPRLVPGGPVPRPEHLRALRGASAGLARRRVAGG